MSDNDWFLDEQTTAARQAMNDAHGQFAAMGGQEGSPEYLVALQLAMDTETAYFELRPKPTAGSGTA